MEKMSLLVLCASLSLGAAAEVSKTELKNNPLLTESILSYHYPAFDKITNEDYAPAFEEGMRLESAEVARIAGNKANPTFANSALASW